VAASDARKGSCVITLTGAGNIALFISALEAPRQRGFPRLGESVGGGRWAPPLACDARKGSSVITLTGAGNIELFLSAFGSPASAGLPPSWSELAVGE
jgi:hypothetical protein